MKVTLILYILKKKLDKGRRLTSFNQNANPSIFAVNNWNDRYQDIIAATKYSRDEKYSTLLPNSKRTANNKIINNTNNSNELNNLNNNINNNSNNNNNDIKIIKPNPKETIKPLQNFAKSSSKTHSRNNTNNSNIHNDIPIKNNIIINNDNENSFTVRKTTQDNKITINFNGNNKNNKIKTENKPPRVNQIIQLMDGVESYNILEELKNTPAHITLAQLLNISSSLRSDVTKSFRKSRGDDEIIVGLADSHNTITDLEIVNNPSHDYNSKNVQEHDIAVVKGFVNGATASSSY